MKVHKCKAHQYAHLYTVCHCGAQYCARVWEACPRCSERLQAGHTEINGVRTSVRTPPPPAEEKKERG